MKEMKEELKEAKQQVLEAQKGTVGFASEIIKDLSKENDFLRRTITIILVICVFLSVALVGVGTYTMYLLNDIETVEEVEKIDYDQDIDDIGSIENSNIANGGYNGKD